MAEKDFAAIPVSRTANRLDAAQLRTLCESAKKDTHLRTSTARLLQISGRLEHSRETPDR